MRRRRLAAGRVRRAHGTEGWLRVTCFSSVIDHLAGLREVALDLEGTPIAVEGARVVSEGLLLKLRGIDTREQAEALSGRDVWVEREAAAPAGEGEYHVGDLTGCVVRWGERTVGEVAAFIEGGATALMEIRGGDGRLFLVPFLADFVGEVSIDRGVVELKEGFDLQGLLDGPAV